MKRLFLCILVLMLSMTAFAYTGIDWTKYPDDELQSTIDELREMLNEANAEMTQRKNTAKAKAKNKPKATKAPKNLGMKTEKLLSSFKSYMKPFGISTYPMELTDKDKKSDSLVVLFTQYCSLYINQKNGKVESFRIVSKEDDGTDRRIDEITAAFLGGIMLTNTKISTDDAIAFLTQISDSGMDKVLNGISYRVITGKPFTTIVSLEVKPAE